MKKKTPAFQGMMNNKAPKMNPGEGQGKPKGTPKMKAPKIMGQSAPTRDKKSAPTLKGVNLAFPSKIAVKSKSTKGMY